MSRELIPQYLKDFIESRKAARTISSEVKPQYSRELRSNLISYARAYKKKLERLIPKSFEISHIDKMAIMQALINAVYLLDQQVKENCFLSDLACEWIHLAIALNPNYGAGKMLSETKLSVEAFQEMIKENVSELGDQQEYILESTSGPKSAVKSFQAYVQSGELNPHLMDEIYPYLLKERAIAITTFISTHISALEEKRKKSKKPAEQQQIDVDIVLLNKASTALTAVSPESSQAHLLVEGESSTPLVNEVLKKTNDVLIDINRSHKKTIPAGLTTSFKALKKSVIAQLEHLNNKAIQPYHADKLAVIKMLNRALKNITDGKYALAKAQMQMALEINPQFGRSMLTSTTEKLLAQFQDFTQKLPTDLVEERLPSEDVFRREALKTRAEALIRLIENKIEEYILILSGLAIPAPFGNTGESKERHDFIQKSAELTKIKNVLLQGGNAATSSDLEKRKSDDAFIAEMRKSAYDTVNKLQLISESQARQKALRQAEAQSRLPVKPHAVEAIPPVEIIPPQAESVSTLPTHAPEKLTPEQIKQLDDSIRDSRNRSAAKAAEALHLRQLAAKAAEDAEILEAEIDNASSTLDPKYVYPGLREAFELEASEQEEKVNDLRREIEALKETQQSLLQQAGMKDQESHEADENAKKFAKELEESVDFFSPLPTVSSEVSAEESSPIIPSRAGFFNSQAVTLTADQLRKMISKRYADLLSLLRDEAIGANAKEKAIIAAKVDVIKKYMGSKNELVSVIEQKGIKSPDQAERIIDQHLAKVTEAINQVKESEFTLPEVPNAKIEFPVEEESESEDEFERPQPGV